MRSTPRTVVVSVALLALGLAGCGVTTQATPRAIPSEDVPFELSGSEAPVATTVPPGLHASMVVYFVASSGLGAVTRDIEGQPSPSTALDALVAGPTAEEARAGLRSALLPDTKASVALRDRRATVRLDEGFLQANRVEQGLAVAQIVYTLTEVSGVDSVRLLVGGQPLAVSVEGGKPTTDAITRDQVVIPEIP